MGVAEIAMIGLEKIVNNQRGPVKDYRRVVIGVLSELGSSKHAVEDKTRIWQGSRLDSYRLNSSGIWSVGRTKMRIQDVIITGLIRLND